MKHDLTHPARGQTDADAQAVWRELHAAASAPYRQAGRFAWHFARGKLGHDPVFRALLERGDLPPGARVLDIGCGQGLLASLLHTIDQRRHAPDASMRWPAAWPEAPFGARYTGIELMPRDVARAQAALGGEAGQFIQGDMCDCPFPPSDVVVILDVLHYVDHASQQHVLERVHSALPPRGRLLLRVGDAAGRRGFAISQWVDRAVLRARGHRGAARGVRSLADWIEAVRRLGFDVEAVPMSQGTPFANVLLVADRR